MNANAAAESKDKVSRFQCVSSCKTMQDHSKTLVDVSSAGMLVVIDSLLAFVLRSGWLLHSSRHPGWSVFKENACGLIAFLVCNGVPQLQTASIL